MAVDAIVDSGGILGNIPQYAINGDENAQVGTLISVYTEDDVFLYSYRTTRANSPAFTEGSEFNTGYMPFSQTSIYFDYSGSGTTVFNYR